MKRARLLALVLGPSAPRRFDISPNRRADRRPRRRGRIGIRRSAAAPTDPTATPASATSSTASELGALPPAMEWAITTRTGSVNAHGRAITAPTSAEPAKTPAVRDPVAAPSGSTAAMTSTYIAATGRRIQREPMGLIARRDKTLERRRGRLAWHAAAQRSRRSLFPRPHARASPIEAGAGAVVADRIARLGHATIKRP